MPSIRLERLTFGHADAVPLLSLAEASFPSGWTALVGENGAGKSTLLRLVSGALRPIEGTILVSPEGARVVLCPQEVGHVPGEDARDLARRDDGEARRLRGLLALAPESVARWETLSPGERKRWQIGAALASAPDVLLLDEPTNHADAAARAVLLGALRKFGGVGVVVSHDRTLIKALAVRTLRLHRGRLRTYAAPYAEARIAWEAEAKAAWDRRAALQEEARDARARLAGARRERDAAERSRSGRGRDPKDSDGRSVVKKNRQARAEGRLARDVARLRDAAERAEGRVEDVPPRPEPGRSLFLGFERAPRPVLLSLDAPVVHAGAAPVLRDVHVRLRRDDRIRVEGVNGAGKSTLLGALLAGSDLPADRLLVLPQELGPGAGASLLAEVRALDPSVRGRVLSLVAALGSDPDRLLASADPSPGEARKLLLALGMGRHAWALVLDEPTNHLDLPSVERLEEALSTYPGALLLVSHDDAFAGRCTTSCWRVERGRVETGGG
jgi:ATPase subunit of ABC transporter with duplicated ATPase domains